MSPQDILAWRTASPEGASNRSPRAMMWSASSSPAEERKQGRSSRMGGGFKANAKRRTGPRCSLMNLGKYSARGYLKGMASRGIGSGSRWRSGELLCPDQDR